MTMKEFENKCRMSAAGFAELEKEVTPDPLCVGTCPTEALTDARVDTREKRSVEDHMKELIEG
jgi:Fe-S-cluster-containing dehydrogenase component